MQVEHQIDPHGGTEQDPSAVRLVRLARLAVNGHDRRTMALQAERHDAGDGAVDQAQANALAGPHRLVGARPAVQRHQVAEAAGHCGLHPIVEPGGDAAVARQSPIGDEPQQIAIDGDGLAFLDDQWAR